MNAITFTSNEADVLRHRLCHLSEMDAEDLAELFPDHEEPGALAKMAELAADALYDGHLTVIIAHDDTALVLIEAIEGSTHHEVSHEAEQAGRISKQKRVAYINAMHTAAAKISAATGREAGAMTKQPIPPLLPCPFCGQSLKRNERKHNPYARCVTEGCKGAQLPLLNLDQPDDIKAWNTRRY